MDSRHGHRFSGTVEEYYEFNLAQLLLLYCLMGGFLRDVGNCVHKSIYSFFETFPVLNSDGARTNKAGMGQLPPHFMRPAQGTVAHPEQPCTRSPNW